MPSVWNQEVTSYTVDVFRASTLNYDRSVSLDLADGGSVSIRFPSSPAADFVTIGASFHQIELPQHQFDEIVHMLQTEKPITGSSPASASGSFSTSIRYFIACPFVGVRRYVDASNEHRDESTFSSYPILPASPRVGILLPFGSVEPTFGRPGKVDSTEPNAATGRDGGGHGILGVGFRRGKRHGVLMADDAVIVRNLRKTYGERAVVDDVSFEIARGETFALLGPNGAGKSTTVEILEGYRRRTGGDVSVLGTDPGHGGLDWKARIGIVLQSTGQSGQLSVREQLTQYAGFFREPRDIDQVIDAVGLREQARMRISRLSGGQQRRVDVALGIIGRPDLLFLDEPTTGFDPQARRDFWELIRGLKSEGTTILLTTHYLDEAAQLSDRVAVIAAGRLRAIGAVDEIGGREARIPLVRWKEAGMLREERIPDPFPFARALADRLGGDPEDLEIVRPSLEDVYLSLVADAEASDLAPSEVQP